MSLRYAIPGLSRLWRWTAIFLITVLPVEAQFTVDVKGGLNDQDRELIAMFPEKLRAQVDIALRNAINLMHENILTYLATVDRILKEETQRLQCAAVGTEINFIDQFGKKLGFNPKPIDEMYKDLASIRQQITASTTPASIRARYADWFYRTGMTACSANISPVARQEVAELELETRPSYVLWSRLDRYGCASPENCFDRLKAEVGQQLTTGQKSFLRGLTDLGDLEGAFKKIQKPVGRTEGFGPFSSTVQAKIEEFEGALKGLERISDALEIAKAFRDHEICLADMDYDRGTRRPIEAEHKLQWQVKDSPLRAVCDGWGINTEPTPNVVGKVDYVIPRHATHFKGIWMLRACTIDPWSDNDVLVNDEGKSGLHISIQRTYTPQPFDIVLPKGAKKLTLQTNATNNACRAATWYQARFTFE